MMSSTIADRSDAVRPLPASAPGPPAPALRLEWLIALGLAAATFLTRLPQRTAMLAYWDGILYARALDDFNPAAHQPQPPGYVFYVLSARLVRWLTGAGANDAYVWVSQAAAAGAVAAVYLVAARLYGRAAALAAGLVAATAVAPWSYSGVAYPYTVLLLGSAALGGLAWALRRRRVAPWLAGLLLGLAGGFRQDLLLFLGPLVLAALGRRPIGHYLGAGAGLAAGGLAWFIPSALAAGGVDAYLGALTRQTALVERDTSITADGLAGLAWNLDHLRLFVVDQTLRWATLPLAVFAVAALWTGALRRDPRLHHLLLWLLPATLFYSLIHLGDVGYTFSLAPPLFIAAGAGAVTLARWAAALPLWRDRRLALPLGLTVTPALVAWSLAAAGSALENDYVMYHTGRQYSLLWTRCRDGWLAGGVALLRERYRPDETLLVAAGYYQHARHYLPEFPTWLADPVDGPVFRRPAPPGVRYVVAFGHRLATRDQPNEERITVSCDLTLSIFRVEPGQVVVYRPDELWIEPAPDGARLPPPPPPARLAARWPDAEHWAAWSHQPTRRSPPRLTRPRPRRPAGSRRCRW